MESSQEGTEPAQSAAQQLAQFEQMQDHDAALRPSRGYWYLMLWAAVFVGAYTAVFLYSYSAGGDQITSQPVGYQMSLLLVIPAIGFSLLVSGARDRFAVRTTYSWRYWLLLVPFIGGFVALGVLWFSDIGYPWWLNIALPLLLFITMAAEPIRQLRSRSPRGTQSW